MKLSLYIQIKPIEEEMEELYLEYEIDSEMGRKGIKFNRFEDGKSLSDELEKCNGKFPTDSSGLMLLDFYKPNELLLVGHYEINSKEDIPKTIIQAKNELKITNPELFV